MPALPRDKCPKCKREVALRRNGAFREHTEKKGGARKCSSSGRILRRNRGKMPVPAKLPKHMRRKDAYDICHIEAPGNGAIGVSHQDLQALRRRMQRSSPAPRIIDYYDKLQHRASGQKASKGKEQGANGSGRGAGRKGRSKKTGEAAAVADSFAGQAK